MSTIRIRVLTGALLLLAAGCSSSSEVQDTTSGVEDTTSEVEDTTSGSEDTTSGVEDTAADLPERDFSAVTAEIADFVDSRSLNGAGLIVVHEDDGVVYHEHFGEFSPDRISLIASSSKMISAGVLLNLQDQGMIDIDAPISDYVEWGGADSGITTAQLLSNSSGLVGLGPNLLYPPYLCQWDPAAELEACGETIISSPDDDGDVIAPDTEFRYGGAQWQVAGAVAEAVSGKPWGQLIDEIYTEPCGLDSLGYLSLGSVLDGSGLGYPAAFGGDPDGVEPTENPNIEGGAFITTGDYGALLLMHLRDGRCGDTDVLSTGALATMHADRIASAYDGSGGTSDTGYGMGWWVDRETDRISDGGAFGTVPWLDLDDGYGAYLVVEATSNVGSELADLIMDHVHDAVTDV